jgi:ElaB/YqjD/DUF883 family membrane-anchored ribosome-binding protein
VKINLKAALYICFTVLTCLSAGSLFADDKTVGEKVDQGIDKVEEVAKSAKDKTKEAGKDIKEKAGKVKDKTKEVAKKTKDKAKKETKKSKHKAKKHLYSKKWRIKQVLIISTLQLFEPEGLEIFVLGGVI